MGASALIEKWFPPSPDRAQIEPLLQKFYESNSRYHDMTGGGDKTTHPHVQLLRTLVRPGGEYAEIGCGSGAVCRMAGETARVYAFDVSSVAVKRAVEYCMGSNVILARAKAEQIPLADNSVDGCYAFEVLEHVWEPLSVVREMVRITRPDGFIFISAPNAFSLDLYLRKRILARGCEMLLAAIRFARDSISGRAYHNVTPHLDGDIYPDCDMITSLIPCRFARAVEGMGCHVDFWDTTYMCAHRAGSGTDLRFQRNTATPFLRHFGDHILMLAHKKRPIPMTLVDSASLYNRIKATLVLGADFVVGEAPGQCKDGDGGCEVSSVSRHFQSLIPAGR